MLQLVIPAYNEQARLPRTLRELRRHVRDLRSLARPVEVIVVDNASTDDTAAVARAADSAGLRVRVIGCPTRGKGAAVRAGIQATDASIVGFMDADGATSLDALEEACRRLALGADVAIGSRGTEGAVTAARHSWLRERGARTYRACTARVVPGIEDTQCGFKLMAGDLGRRVFADLRTTGFSFDVEVLARARALGARIDEFPVSWTDVPGSTFEPLRHGAGSFADLALIAWHVRASRGAAPLVLPTPAVASPVAVEA
jgi:glycosyltransferase involved in cell wall biosynthesis